MLQVDIAAQTRNTFGKGAARTIRRAGNTPAVLYGSKIEPVALELNTKDFTKSLLFINRRNAVVSLKVDAGKTKHVMVKEIQSDPVQDTLVHADFIEISLDADMNLEVPIKFAGKAKGVDLGGEMHTHLNSIVLSGKPLDIPDFIEIDVTSLEIGDSLACSDLDIPGGISMLTDESKTCVSITTASVAPVEEEEEAEQPAAADEAPAEEAAPAAE